MTTGDQLAGWFAAAGIIDLCVAVVSYGLWICIFVALLALVTEGIKAF